MLITLIAYIFILIICLKLYCVLTCGVNTCSKHLVGKVVIVTGGSSGIGFETAKDLAYRGARVIIACKNQQQSVKARDDIIGETGNNDVFYQHIDLASFTSIRHFVDGFLKTQTRLDILINNAGVLESVNKTTEDGVSRGMQVNHFGPFLLTNLLLPLLKSSAPSRIINVSSLAYRASTVDFQNFERISVEKFGMVTLYSSTKLCNVLMTVELERLLRGTGVTVNCLHPGLVRTSTLLDIESKWAICQGVVLFFSKSPWQGAQTSVYLAVAPEVSELSGCYFSDCRLKKLSEKALDPVLARKVWEVSERIVKL